MSNVLADIEAGETAVPLTRLPDEPYMRRGGRKPTISLGYRWAERGLKGHRLETAQFGGTRVTTKNAVFRFLAALSRGAGARHVTPAARQRKAEKLDRELQKAGA
jgi:hypothetical protein